MKKNKKLFNQSFRERPKSEMIGDIFRQKEVALETKKAKEKEEKRQRKEAEKQRKKKEMEKFLNRPLFGKKKRTKTKGKKLRVSAQAGIKGFFR